MLLHIPDVLTLDQLATCRTALDKADWVNGQVTAGFQSARVKDNTQIPETHPTAKMLGDMILAALEQSPLFMSATLALRVFPPLFSRYVPGQQFGTHVDGAIRQVRGTSHRIRTDMSATLFLSAPEEYEGGELVVEDQFGLHSVKLPAGGLVVYPSSSLHRVQPITSGVRLVSFFWLQSMVRDDGQRTLLFDLDRAIQALGSDVPEHAAMVSLTGVYHNLIRRWGDL